MEIDLVFLKLLMSFYILDLQNECKYIIFRFCQKPCEKSWKFIKLNLCMTKLTENVLNKNK